MEDEYCLEKSFQSKSHLECQSHSALFLGGGENTQVMPMAGDDIIFLLARKNVSKNNYNAV